MQAASNVIELQVPRDTRPTAVHRRDPMTRVRITCRTNNQVIPGGYVLPKGDTTCLVYTPDLPAIMALIERDAGKIQEAEGYFLKQVEESIKEELHSITDAEVRSQRLARAREEYSGSVEGMFHFLHKRDIKPLIDVVVLDENIPAPVQQQQVEQQSFLAQTIAKEVATALAAALPAVVAAAVQAVKSDSTQPAAAPKQQQR